MIPIFFKFYYILLFFIVYTYSPNFLNVAPSRPLEYVMFASPFNFFLIPIGSHSFIYLSALLLCFACIIRPSKIVRICTSVLVLLTISINYSYGKISSSIYIWMISSVLLCFFSLSQPMKSRKNLFLIRFVQGLLLSHYFISGLWKLRSIIASKFQFSFSDIVKEYIAYGFAESAGGGLVQTFLKMPIGSIFLSFGYLFVLVFQLTSLLPVFYNRLFVFYGWVAVLFHFSTGVILNIYFKPTVLAVLFFLIITEFLMEKEMSALK